MRLLSSRLDSEDAPLGFVIDIRIDVLHFRRRIPVLCLVNAIKADDGITLDGERRGSLTQHGDVVRGDKQLAAKLAEKCEVQFAYAIGYPDPVSINVDTFGTAKVDEAKIIAAVNKVFSFQPADIIEQLDLRRPIYSKTTNYGHFGKKDKDLTWENTDKVEALLKNI